MRWFIRSTAISSLVCMLLGGGAFLSLEAATIFVPSQECPTIQGAIDAAQQGDVILIFPGKYQENLIIDGKTVDLLGKNRETTIIDGGNKAPCLILKNGSNGRIQNMTICHGNAKGNGGEGGGIACYQSNPTIQHNIFRNNAADEGMGGSIFCFQSSPVIKNNEFYHNRADYGLGGAIYAFRSAPVICYNTFIGNQTNSGEGGAISLIESEGDIQDNTFIGNLAGKDKDIQKD